MAALALLISAAPAQANPDLRARNGPWMGLGVGVSSVDALDLSDNARGAIVSKDSAAPSFALQVFYTTLRFDFGGLLRHMAGGDYERPNATDGQLGSMISAGPLIRWRYWNTVAGPFYLSLMPAWTAAGHSDVLRRDVAVMHGVDADDVPPVTHGISGTMSTGFIWMISPDIALDVNANVTLFESDLMLNKPGLADTCDGDPCVNYDRNRAGARLSLLWTL